MLFQRAHPSVQYRRMGGCRYGGTTVPIPCIMEYVSFLPYSAIGCWRYRKTTRDTVFIRVYRGTHSTFSRRTRIFHRRYVLPPLYRASTSLPCFHLSTVLLPLYRASTSLPYVHLSTACPPWIHGGIIIYLLALLTLGRYLRQLKHCAFNCTLNFAKFSGRYVVLTNVWN